VAQYDFEDGTLQGWSSFCGATLTNTTEAAESGTHSLKATGRTQNCAGPSIQLVSLLLPQATYQITAWVRLTPGESSTDTANITIKQVDSASGTTYVTLGNYATNVTSSGWTLLLYLVSGVHQHEKTLPAPGRRESRECAEKHRPRSPESKEKVALNAIKHGSCEGIESFWGEGETMHGMRAVECRKLASQ
jgi:hypothetical protein